MSLYILDTDTLQLLQDEHPQVNKIEWNLECPFFLSLLQRFIQSLPHFVTAL
jgi:hypothetical protein